MKTSSTEIF